MILNIKSKMKIKKGKWGLKTIANLGKGTNFGDRTITQLAESYSTRPFSTWTTSIPQTAEPSALLQQTAVRNSRGLTDADAIVGGGQNNKKYTIFSKGTFQNPWLFEEGELSDTSFPSSPLDYRKNLLTTLLSSDKTSHDDKKELRRLQYYLDLPGGNKEWIWGDKGALYDIAKKYQIGRDYMKTNDPVNIWVQNVRNKVKEQSGIDPDVIIRKNINDDGNLTDKYYVINQSGLEYLPVNKETGEATILSLKLNPIISPETILKKQFSPNITGEKIKDLIQNPKIWEGLIEPHQKSKVSTYASSNNGLAKGAIFTDEMHTRPTIENNAITLSKPKSTKEHTLDLIYTISRLPNSVFQVNGNINGERLRRDALIAAMFHDTGEYGTHSNLRNSHSEHSSSLFNEIYQNAKYNEFIGDNSSEMEFYGLLHTLQPEDVELINHMIKNHMIWKDSDIENFPEDNQKLAHYIIAMGDHSGQVDPMTASLLSPKEAKELKLYDPENKIGKYYKIITNDLLPAWQEAYKRVMELINKQYE